MKVIWEADDIEVGLRVAVPGTREVCMIGYRVDDGVPQGGRKRYVLISLSDGMVNSLATSDKMALDLTEGGYVPLSLIKQPAKSD